MRRPAPGPEVQRHEPMRCSMRCIGARSEVQHTARRVITHCNTGSLQRAAGMAKYFFYFFCKNRLKLYIRVAMYIQVS